MLDAYAGTILLVIGVVTVLAVALVFAPRLGLRLVFGDDAPDILTKTLARHWGLLVALVGGLLIYAAYHPEVRIPVLAVAAIEKLAVGLFFGTALPRRPIVMLVIAGDAVMALLCLLLLFT
jgi:hypothetical protein